MSNRLSTLRTESRRLKALLADLIQASREPPSWDATVCCERTLGASVPVERWYLAEHFLTTWQEWKSSVDRHVRYFGTRAEQIPATWKALVTSCANWQKQLWQDSELDQRLAASWQSFETRTPVGNEDAGTMFRQIIASHHRLMILPSASAYAWTESRRIATQIDRHVCQVFDASPPGVKRDVIWHLRQYRHATLDFSWLDEARWREGFTAFEHALGNPGPAPEWLAAVRGDLSANLAAHAEIGAVTARIVQAIHEAGFDAFVTDVTSREMAGGLDSPLGSDHAVVVGGHTGPPRALSEPIVLAVARGTGRRGRGALSAVLGNVVQLLATAASAFAIIVGDSWNASIFAEQFLPQFRELYDHGHRFLFLVVGAPETDVAPIPVTLSGQRQLVSTSSMNITSWIESPGRRIDFEA